VERPSWAPEGVEIDKPNAARMYDYALGGAHNFAVDRDLVRQAEQNMPGVAHVAHANRAFLGRLVRWLVAAGVRQFLDIGSGIPTLGNVHEVAQRAANGSRVMYVDIDPVAVAHSRLILDGNADAAVIEGDLRRPGEILRDPTVLSTLDFGRPVAVLLVAVLHFVPDEDDPAGIVGRLVDALVPGSYVGVSHGTQEDNDDDAATVSRFYRRTTTPLHLRTRREVLALVNGLSLVEPGLVPVTDWHPDPSPEPAVPCPELLGLLGRKAGGKVGRRAGDAPDRGSG
jgi:hypothetical protein